MLINGEAELGADGVMQGWCWNPARPGERQVLEVVINERIVSTFIASRFREDLRDRNIGDGYYGFIATLSKSIVDAGDRFVISARERGSGFCIWRQIRGEVGLPSDYSPRLSEAQRGLSRVAMSNCVGISSAYSRVSTLSLGLGALGTYLRTVANFKTQHPTALARARAAVLQKIGTVNFPVFQNPKVAVIVNVGAICDELLLSLSRAAPGIQSIEASVLLIDHGLHPDVALAPSIFRNVRYIFDGEDNLPSPISTALKYSHGDLMIFVNSNIGNLMQGLPELVAQMRNTGAVYANARCVEIAAGICAESAESIVRHSANFPIGLDFAATREYLEEIGGLTAPEDRVTGIQDIDLAVRVMRDRAELCIWDEPPLSRNSAHNAETTN